MCFTSFYMCKDLLLQGLNAIDEIEVGIKKGKMNKSF